MGYTRREVISQALIAGAGVTVIGAFPEPARALSNHETTRSDAFDPTFLSGQILALRGNGGLVVMEDDDRIRRARLGSRTQIWKHGSWGQTPLGLGDCLYATGNLDADNVFNIDSLWIEIYTFLATIHEAEGPSLMLALPDKRPFQAKLLKSSLLQGANGRFAQSDQADAYFASGDLSHVVGFRDPLTDDFTPTKMYRASSDLGGTSSAELQPTRGEPVTVMSPDGPLVLCPLTWHGLASFFCCGNASGCGSCDAGYCCGSSGQGWCTNQTCHSYNHQMAWKNITGPSGSCNASCSGTGSCCDTTLAQFACGTNATLTNVCQSKTDVATVVDCGPNIHCRSAYGCGSRTVVKFDLTPCSFAALGGTFTDGAVTCDVTFEVQC